MTTVFLALDNSQRAEGLVRQVFNILGSAGGTRMDAATAQKKNLHPFTRDRWSRPVTLHAWDFSLLSTEKQINALQNKLDGLYTNCGTVIGGYEIHTNANSTIHWVNQSDNWRGQRVHRAESKACPA